MREVSKRKGNLRELHLPRYWLYIKGKGEGNIKGYTLSLVLVP